ncbi:MAG: phosphoribosylformylglycinamidine synthase subunit PurS [Candidatus Omnitrophica bacterium]|nr:phosphoribosylformylglycinamidine synthase subunit PurS [Candidatus Omnitrophota bacterium]
MFEAKIYITLKETVADPQGLTIKHSLESLGYKGLQKVRIGKLITIRLDVKSKKEAEKQIKEMCEKLLANPIIENYNFKIEEA